MKANPLPEHEVLHGLLIYTPETGSLLWKPRPASMFRAGRYQPERLAKTWNTRFAGTPALSSPMSNGYFHGAIGYKSYLRHRVVWKLATGNEPDVIDHINGNRADDRISNLRSCTHADNMRNRGVASNNTSGAIGVYARPFGRWCAQIEYDGAVENLGTFDTFEEATAARWSAEARLGFHPHHGARPCHTIAAASLSS